MCDVIFHKRIYRLFDSDIAACDFDGGCFGDSGDSVISEAFNAVRGEAEIFLQGAPVPCRRYGRRSPLYGKGVP